MLPLPLTTLIKQLRAAGFPLDPGREMRLRRVVHERGAEYIGRFGEMKYLLAPFVASRPEEQRNFYAFWDQYVAELERDWKGESDEKGDDSSSMSRGWRWLLLPFLGLLAYGAFRYFNPKSPPPVGEQFAINIGLPGAAADSVYEKHTRLTEGDTLRLLNRTQGKLRGADSTGFTWRVENTQTGVVERIYQTFALEMARPLVQGEGLRAILVGDHLGLPPSKSADTMLFVVQCANPPSLPKIKVAEGAIEVGVTHGYSVIDPEEGVTYDWGFEDRRVEGTSVSHAFTKKGRFTVSVQAIRGGQENIASCYSLAFVEVQVVPKGHDLPILASIPLERDEPRAFAARSTVFQVGKWLALLLLFIPYAFWKYRQFNESRREKTDEEIAEAYPIFDQGPYNVPYRSRNDQISVPADFYRIADQLRVREEGETRVFDGAATIEATVNSGGFPSWQERSLRRPADYLVLVTHNDEFNQQDLLLKRLTGFLSAREAAITVYYHEGQFEHFWNKDYPKGWSPDRLYDRYQQFRLLVLGNAHGLVDNYASREPRLRPDKAVWLKGWARRLVLTTEPSSDWTAQEVLLYRNALLYPLTLNGLNEGVRMLNETEEYEPHDFVKWRTLHQRTNPEPSARYRKWETVADHEDYLQGDPELMRWLRGLAVTGNPDWNLTISIGRALDIEVTHDRLLQLSRIPWLAGNRPDHDLRFALLAGLVPQDEAAARTAVIKELELVEDSVKEAFAQTEWQTNLAVHQLHLAPASAPQKASLREMIRAGLFTTDQLRDLELAAQRKESPIAELSTKAGPPPIRPGGLDRLLARDERPWKDTRSGRIVIGTIALATCLLLFLISQLTPERELASGEAVPWWASVTVVDDTALEANNAAVELWQTTEANIKDQDGEISIEDAKNLAEIKSKLKHAWNIRGENYPLVAHNRWKTYLNEDGYRLNAAYLDLAADKEVAFRDLLEEASGIEWAGNTPEDLFLPVEHQHGLKLFGLYQTLDEKYPLGEFPPSERRQLEKEFSDIRWQSSAITGLLSAEGKLSDGRDVRDLRDERDSLLADAEGTLRLIEQVTDSYYFDSLTLVMPVNLRTMITGINEGPVEYQEPVQQTTEDEQTSNEQQSSTGSEGSPEDDSERTETIQATSALLTRFNDNRYNQTLNFESTRGSDQSAHLKRLLTLFRVQDRQGPVLIDAETLRSDTEGNIYEGEGHSDAGLILLKASTPGLDADNDAATKKIRENTHAVIVTWDHSFNPAVTTGPDLMLNANRLVQLLNELGANVYSLRNPTQKELKEELKVFDDNKLNQASQFILVLNLQATDAAQVLTGKEGEPTVELPPEAIEELQDLLELAGHSLMVVNALIIGELPVPDEPVTQDLNSLSSAELLTFIRKFENRPATIFAQSIVKQTGIAVSLNDRLIEELVKQGGGRNGDNNLFYPDYEVPEEFYSKKLSPRYQVKTPANQLVEMLSLGYRNLSVPDTAERLSFLQQRFTDPPSGKQSWNEATFTGLTIAEAILILEEINADLRAAEKAYLLALAESLAAAGE